MYIEQNDQQLAAIHELLSVSCDESAKLLSKFTAKPIGLNCSQVEMVAASQCSSLIPERMRDETNCWIYQCFKQPANGIMTLLLSVQDAITLYYSLVNEQAYMKKLTEMEEEVLMETGNIVLNGFLSQLSYLYNQSFVTNLPAIEASSLQDFRHFSLLRSASGCFQGKLTFVLPQLEIMALVLWNECLSSKPDAEC